MADNTVLNTGSGGDTISTDDIGGVKVQRVKVQFGTDGSATDVNSGTPLPVTQSGVALEAGGNLAAISAAAGATTDTETVGNGSIIAILKKIRTYLSSLVAQLLDYDTGAGTATTPVFGIALPASGGPVAGATHTNPLVTGIDAQSSGGWTPYRLVSGASDNSTSVKAQPSQIGYVVGSNVNAGIRYLHIYDKATAPTLGTDTPVLTFPLLGNTSGAGVVLGVPAGITFANGIGIAITTTTGTIPASGNVAANEITVSLGYK